MEDNELRQALALMDAYKDRVEAMSRQVQVLRVSLDEVTMALEAVKAFKDAKEGDEIMVPVGASSFIPVKVTGNRTVITGIGSGISIQKTADESIEYLESNSAEIAEALKKSVEALNESQQNLAAMNEAVQQEYAARRQSMGVQ
ncbi:MAG: prefoldin subunit alpha [Thermoplasmata archaeon]|nr:prefoldin subunit alpha [Thermoplasmata archaeon]